MSATLPQSIANQAATAAAHRCCMTRNHGAAAQRRIPAVAEGARSAIRILTRAVRKYLEPGYLVAMVRYWSRLGVGSYAAFEAARPRAPAPPRRPAAQAPAPRGPRAASRRAQGSPGGQAAEDV